MLNHHSYECLSFYFFQKRNHINFLIDNNTDFSSPQGDDQEDGFDTKTLFQGDIKDPGRRKTGGLIGEAGTRTPWPNAVIPYVFDCSVRM